MNLLERFPALQKLGGRGWPRQLPVVRQTTATECGAACIVMALGFHRKYVRLADVRDVVGVGRDGADALSLLKAARFYGLRGRGVRIDLDSLENLDEGTILHWELNHFVVFERCTDAFVHIVDPAFGRRKLSREDFGQAFTGIALLLEPGEDFEPSDESAGRIGRHVSQVLVESGQWARILVTSLLIQLCGLAVPVLTGSLVDRVLPRRDYDLLAVLGAGLGVLVAFQFLAAMVRAHLLLHVRTYLDARMTLGFIEHLVELPYAFFQRRSAGDLILRLNSNATIREILTGSALSVLIDGAMVVLYLAVLLLASAGLGLLVLGLGALQLSLVLFTSKRQRELMSKNLDVQAKAQSYQVEILTGIETLKVTGAEHRAVEQWSHMFVDQLNVGLSRGELNALVEAATSTLRIASPLAVLAYGAVRVLRGDLSLGTMLSLSALANGFLVPLASIAVTAAQFQTLGSYLERINDVLDAPPEQDRTRVRPAGALQGQIALDRVSFRYGPLAPLVVQDVSLDIRPGQFVALVGPSGSGKSSLAGLLLGLYLPTSGRIAFDGEDLSELDLRSVRRQLGIVPQKPYLFGTTIRANIALSDPAVPLAGIIDAAKQACIHDEVVAMPMGYDTLLIDGGASLSGGQRQRIALARALVRKPVVLLLDEATSALDTVTEARVQKQLDALRCTRIVIAHRLSTVMRADVILVMDGGRLVEQGTHAELLTRGGLYASLVAAQLAVHDAAAAR